MFNNWYIYIIVNIISKEYIHINIEKCNNYNDLNDDSKTQFNSAKDSNSTDINIKHIHFLH